MENQASTKRIAKNTLMLYFRQILIILVNLYAVRVVLNVLGAEDYGIYNVVAGIVTMFIFVKTTMANASQRFFSFDLGKNDITQLCKTYSVTIQIYLLFVLLIVLVAETLGLWMINNKLIIPVERLYAANFVYQFAVLSFIFSLLSSPFIALIISFEDMDIYALISIAEALLKLVIIFLLRLISFDKLILYGILLFVVDLIICCIYLLYKLLKYKNVKLHFEKNKSLFNEIVSYSGWNLIGAVANVLKIQGNNIILNLFFGPIVNAARSISTQVNTAISSFAQNFSTALRPQLIKSYAAENTEEVYKYVNQGSKLTYFLMLIFTLPLVLETEEVLTLWLRNPPNYSVVFVRLFLLEGLVTSLTYQLMTLAQATGKMKLYQIIVGGILLLNLPISYLLLRLGLEPYIINVVSLSLAFIALFGRLFVIKKITSFSIMSFIMNTLIPCFVITVISFIPGYLIIRNLTQTFGRLFLVVAISALIVTILFWFIGFNKNDRDSIKQGLYRKFHK